MISIIGFFFRKSVFATWLLCASLSWVSCSEPLFSSDPPVSEPPPRPSLSTTPVVQIKPPVPERSEPEPVDDKPRRVILEPGDVSGASPSDETVILVARMGEGKFSERSEVAIVLQPMEGSDIGKGPASSTASFSLLAEEAPSGREGVALTAAPQQLKSVRESQRAFVVLQPPKGFDNEESPAFRTASLAFRAEEAPSGREGVALTAAPQQLKSVRESQRAFVVLQPPKGFDNEESPAFRTASLAFLAEEAPSGREGVALTAAPQQLKSVRESQRAFVVLQPPKGFDNEESPAFRTTSFPPLDEEVLSGNEVLAFTAELTSGDLSEAGRSILAALQLADFETGESASEGFVVVTPSFEFQGEVIPSGAIAEPAPFGILQTDERTFAVLPTGEDIIVKESSASLIIYVEDQGESFSLEEQVPFVETNPNLTTVYFGFNSSDLSEKAKATLDKIVDWLQERPYIDRILLEGHCDSIGTPENNLLLGEWRTKSVKQYLIEQGIPIPAERIDTVSYGKKRPLSDDDELNRRVEVFPIYQ